MLRPAGLRKDIATSSVEKSINGSFLKALHWIIKEFARLMTCEETGVWGGVHTSAKLLTYADIKLF
jgi:hypothetical protein